MTVQRLTLTKGNRFEKAETGRTERSQTRILSVYHSSSLGGNRYRQNGSLSMHPKRPPSWTLTVAALTLMLMYLTNTTPCLAITASDVLEKMSPEQRSGYLTGLVDMYAFQSAQAGDTAHSKCVNDRFYRSETDADPWPGVVDALRQFPDKQPATILFLLMKKTCGG